MGIYVVVYQAVCVELWSILVNQGWCLGLIVKFFKNQSLAGPTCLTLTFFKEMKNVRLISFKKQFFLKFPSSL